MKKQQALTLEEVLLLRELLQGVEQNGKGPLKLKAFYQANKLPADYFITTLKNLSSKGLITIGLPRHSGVVGVKNWTLALNGREDIALAVTKLGRERLKTY